MRKYFSIMVSGKMKNNKIFHTMKNILGFINLDDDFNHQSTNLLFPTNLSLIFILIFTHTLDINIKWNEKNKAIIEGERGERTLKIMCALKFHFVDCLFIINPQRLCAFYVHAQHIHTHSFR
jgi:hypothetical protein